MMRKYLLLLGLALLSACASHKSTANNYETETLRIFPLTKNVFVHVTYLDGDNGMKIPCNGMIYFQDNQALVFDTPTNDRTSEELIKWIETTAKHKIKGVIVNHFHYDCLGGLTVFHEHGIPSYANNMTIQLAKKNGYPAPQTGFDDIMLLDLGRKKVENRYFGEGHTTDNIVSYLVDEKVLFGGCLIKADGASKGNLADANQSEWSLTVNKVKSTYPLLKAVIPGHGNPGDTSLLNYTMALFAN